MKKTVLCALLANRKDTAVNVQKVLTAWGCIIKTRLGLHDGVLENCSNLGLVIMELVGTDEQNADFAHKLEVIDGVSVKLVELENK
jgi:hypothetical protein